MLQCIVVDSIDSTLQGIDIHLLHLLLLLRVVDSFGNMNNKGIVNNLLLLHWGLLLRWDQL